MKRFIITVLSAMAVFAFSSSAAPANAANNAARGAGNAVEGVVEGAGEVVGGAVNGVGTAVEGVVEGTNDIVGNTNDANRDIDKRDDLPNDNVTEGEVLGATDVAANPSTGVGVADMMTVISALGLAGVAASAKKRK